MSDHCGSITEDGAAVCVPGACSCSSETKSSESIRISAPPINKSQNQEINVWKKIRSAVMFGVACIASPCCTPIIIPITIALLARDTHRRLAVSLYRLGIRWTDPAFHC